LVADTGAPSPGGTAAYPYELRKRLRDCALGDSVVRTLDAALVDDSGVFDSGFSSYGRELAMATAATMDGTFPRSLHLA
jgi:hypothetical protein